jgi:hypothetical protein
VKYLKSYNKLFENHQEIHDLCQEYDIDNYSINEDGSIDVDGDVDLSNNGLTKIPLKFRNVLGDFYCHENQLTSLEGAPNIVGGDFNCDDNQLTSLEGAPLSVGGYFSCEYNNLTSLECAPTSIGGDFDCVGNNIASLEGAPQSVGGQFNCGDNIIYDIWELFQDFDKIEVLNDYDPLREIDGKPHVVIDRLNTFLSDIGKKPVEKVDGWINI